MKIVMKLLKKKIFHSVLGTTLLSVHSFRRNGYDSRRSEESELRHGCISGKPFARVGFFLYFCSAFVGGRLACGIQFGVPVKWSTAATSTYEVFIIYLSLYNVNISVNLIQLFFSPSCPKISSKFS